MTTPVLKFDNVRFSYDDGHEILKGISFELAQGERVALVGLNGSGKSTLLLHTDGLLLPSSGQVFVNGIPIDKDSRKNITLSVGMVFQNADDQLFMPSVEEDIAFGPRNMKLPDSEIKQRVDEALSLTGTLHLRKRPPFRLSGGEKRMVAIATVLSMKPSLLVMDEPTSGLDFIATERFLDIVSSLPHTLLMSTHDIRLARMLCSRAILIDKGIIVFDGPVEALPYPPSK